MVNVSDLILGKVPVSEMSDVDKSVVEQNNRLVKKPLMVHHVDLAREFMSHTTLRYINNMINYEFCVVDVYINDVYVCEFSEFYKEVIQHYFDDRFDSDKVIYKGAVIRNEYTVKHCIVTGLYLRSVG